MGFFSDKLAIVTGGASGIGRALGEQLVARGAEVVLADNNEVLLRETAAQIGARGVTVDVRDAEAVRRLVVDAAAAHGGLDYLFNNAGIATIGEVYELELADWDRIIDVNIRGVVHGVHAAYPLMRAQGRGHIVNTASVAGLATTPMLTAYSMSKHAVVGLSRGLRAEAKAFGVKVSVVCPGIIDTPIKTNMQAVAVDNQALVSELPLRMMSAASCARHILKGVQRNQGTIVVTGHGKLLDRLQRFLPGVAERVGDLATARVRRRRR